MIMLNTTDPKRQQAGILTMIRRKDFHRNWTILLAICVLWMVVGGGSAAAQDTGKDIKYEAGFYYTVKKGDTLWGLSQRFNDTPWQWPDLWRENDQITNPHWIYPGERIRLFRKSEQQHIQTPQKVVPSVQPQAEATPSAEEKAPEVYYLYTSMDQVGFIRKPAVQPDGVIFKALDDKKLISADDTVYIRHPESGSLSSNLSPGSRWTVYRTMKPSDAEASETEIGTQHGTQHYLLGVLEIIKNEGRFAIAKIIKSYRAIRIGDLLMPYEKQSPEINVVDSTPGIDGHIINSEDHNKLIGSLFVVFIDKGSRDNIVPGQLYDVYSQETATIGSKGESIALDPVVVGNLIVLRTEDTTSTCLMTDVSRKISAQEKIKTP
jgi:hypothetical protein